LATSDFLRWVERQAQRLRGRLHLAPLAPLDPYSLAQCMRARVFSPFDVRDFPAADLRRLLDEDPRSWSAGSIHLPDGQVAIILNPVHADTRKRASLMEELAHIHLGHKPSKIVISDNIAVRTFSQTQETQAYWVGAAALVPEVVLNYARRRGAGRDRIAGSFGVSLGLVTFRERVTGVRIS
jgi:hypothetical protein